MNPEAVIQRSAERLGTGDDCLLRFRRACPGRSRCHERNPHNAPRAGARGVPTLREPICAAPQFDVPLPDLIRAVREQGLEGLVAKRLGRTYEAGRRVGSRRIRTAPVAAWRSPPARLSHRVGEKSVRLCSREINNSRRSSYSTRTARKPACILFRSVAGCTPGSRA